MVSKPIIGGIQQIGIGNPDTYKLWSWYRKAFFVDIPIFDDAATAELMLRYTGDEPRERHAVLAMSMQGGGGLEIWQYTERKPEAITYEAALGDLGLFMAKIKSKDVNETYNHLKNNKVKLLSNPVSAPDGKEHFYCLDPYDNIVEVVHAAEWFTKTQASTGGIYGCTIGVSDIDQSLKFYKNILGYDQIIYDTTGVQDDYKTLVGGGESYRRVLIGHSQKRQGPFSQWIGGSQLELVQAKDRTPKKLFEGRFWGDMGYIHLCYDIQGMEAMKSRCEAAGHPFTVDSSDSFDMGEAAGHFSYIEDPDGTLIEFVEAHKIPILKKLGWYLDLRKRDPAKPLPKWMLKALSLNRKKD